MVHDCAFVGYELRRELLRRGFEVEHYFFCGLPKITTLEMVYRLKRANCDLIHAHFARSALYASYFSGKEYIAHCHGTDIRHGLSFLQKKCLKKARNVLVSTPDLLDILPAMWLPNPVDTERFRPLREHDGNKVLYFPHWYEDLTETLTGLCGRFGYELTTREAMSVPYENMHLFLDQFDVFVDRFSVPSYSKTALEAMACGIPVVGYRHDLEKALEKLANGDERRSLAKWQAEKILPKHCVKKVVDQLTAVYLWS